MATYELGDGPLTPIDLVSMILSEISTLFSSKYLLRAPEMKPLGLKKVPVFI